MALLVVGNAFDATTGADAVLAEALLNLPLIFLHHDCISFLSPHGLKPFVKNFRALRLAEEKRFSPAELEGVAKFENSRPPFFLGGGVD
jgi:hypothetical protein